MTEDDDFFGNSRWTGVKQAPDALDDVSADLAWAEKQVTTPETH